jgi:cation diffusion facilitator family transporter
MQARRHRYRAMRRVLLVVLGVDLMLAAAKSGYGLLIGSLGMTADGLHSLLHAFGTLVGLVGVTLAARPPDRSHPYGYERYEPFAALGIIAMMLLAVREIASLVWGRLVSGESPVVTSWSLLLMGGATIVAVGLAFWEQRLGQQLDSQVLSTDGRRALGDALVSVSVLVGLGASMIGVPLADLLISVAIAGFILWSGWTKLCELSAILTDAAAGNLDEIARVAGTVAGVRGVHRVRARGAAGSVRVDLHVTVDPQLPVIEAHELTHAVVRRVRATVGGIVEVMVHVGAEPEPDHGGDEHD